MDNKLKLIIKAAKSGGASLKKHFGKDIKRKEKSSAADFVTAADLDSEARILKIIEKEFPGFNIQSEEKGFVDKKSEYTFVIDPLDGTNNFILGIPNFSVMIALMEGEKVIASVIHVPLLGDTYYAEKGEGAFLNGRLISVNKESDIKRASVSYTCGYLTPRDTYLTILTGLYKKEVKRVLSNWSPGFDFCLLSSGKIEALIGKDKEEYDYLAGKLIAREAGAVITDFKGEKELNDRNNTFLVTNGTNIHNELVEAL